MKKEGGREGAGGEKGRRERRNLSTANWHLTATSTRNTSSAAAAADLNTLRKEFREESRTEAVCAPGKNLQEKPSESEIFSGKIL